VVPFCLTFVGHCQRQCPRQQQALPRRLHLVKTQAQAHGKVVCHMCSDDARHIERVALPFVFKYLAAELAAMNIRLTVKVK